MDSTKTTVCSKCGEPMELGHSFCQSCGSRREDVEDTSGSSLKKTQDSLFDAVALPEYIGMTMQVCEIPDYNPEFSQNSAPGDVSENNSSVFPENAADKKTEPEEAQPADDPDEYSSELYDGKEAYGDTLKDELHRNTVKNTVTICIIIAFIAIILYVCSEVLQRHGEPVPEYYNPVCTETLYDSPYFDLSFSAPDGWTLYGGEYVSEMLGGSEAAADYEFYAENQEIMSQLLVMSERIPDADMSVEEYAASFIQGLSYDPELVYEPLSENSDITIAGRQFRLYEGVIHYGDEENFLIRQDICIEKNNDRMLIVVLNYIDIFQKDTYDVLNCFANSGEAISFEFSDEAHR